MTSCRIPGIPPRFSCFPKNYLRFDQTDTKQAKVDYGSKMSSLLLVLFVIAGAIGNSFSNNLDAPAVRDITCKVVQGKKPWCACRSSLSSDVVDLSSLGTEEINASTSSPKFISNEVDGWRILPGHHFARYTETSGKICHGYGSHESSARFYSNSYGPETKKENFYIEFVFSTPDQIVRNGRIRLMCTPDSDKNILTYHGDQRGIEVVKFFSKCNCPNQQCTAKANKTGKTYHLGGGAIAGIVVGTIAFIALILAVWYRRQRQGTHCPVQESGEHDERHHILI